MESILYIDSVERFREVGLSITRHRWRRALLNPDAKSEYPSIKSKADNERGTSRDGVPFPINSDITDSYLVTWDGLDDPKKPFNWPTIRKVVVLATLSLLTISDPLASSMFSPALEDVAFEFRESSDVLISFIVSAYLLGGGLGALVAGPASERYGRLPIYHIGNLLFVISTIGCALSRNTSSLIIFRFLEGCAGAVPLTIGGPTIRDIMPLEKRGPLMALWGLGPLIGPILGPMGGGIICQVGGWRWIFWAIAILLSVISLIGIVTLRETYEPVLLRKKAIAMRERTNNIYYHSQYDEIKSVKRQFGPPVTRPLKLLAFSPVVLCLSLHTAITYGYIYILFTTVPNTFQKLYNFSRTAQGISFIGLGIGLLSGLLLSGIMSYILKERSKAKGIPTESEFILPLMIPGAAAIPIGLILYGWSAQQLLHYMVPIMGTGFIGLGLVSTLIPIQIYLLESFGIHSASALAANVLLRSIFGAFLPLAGPAVFQQLNLGWGSTLLAAISMTFLPVPFLFMKYGKRLRERFPVEL